MPGTFIADDLSAIFDSDELATPATWTASGGSPVASDVMFNLPAAEVFGESTAAFPAVTYRTAPWPTVDVGDLITIDSVDYRVTSVVEQSDGLTAVAELREG